jgi:hypothetical protein
MKLVTAYFLIFLWCGVAFARQSVNCNEPFGPVTADESPHKSYFQKLLSKGDRTALKDFMVLWYPNKKQSYGSDSYLSGCAPKECWIETVYSWGPEAKLRALQEALPDDGVWSGRPNPGHNLYTLSSAVGSFAYGEIPIRIKLKQNSEPQLIRATYLDMERPITSAENIESWSFGTPEHYDEIVRDFKRYESSKTWYGYNYSAYLNRVHGERRTDGDGLFFSPGLDGHDWSEDTLKRNLSEMVRTILGGDGRIYYSHGTCRNRKLEFETRFPTYINPFRAP